MLVTRTARGRAPDFLRKLLLKTPETSNDVISHNPPPGALFKGPLATPHPAQTKPLQTHRNKHPRKTKPEAWLLPATTSSPAPPAVKRSKIVTFVRTSPSESLINCSPDAYHLSANARTTTNHRFVSKPANKRAGAAPGRNNWAARLRIPRSK